jgi:hypothetical protein
MVTFGKFVNLLYLLLMMSFENPDEAEKRGIL